MSGGSGQQQAAGGTGAGLAPRRRRQVRLSFPAAKHPSEDGIRSLITGGLAGLIASHIGRTLAAQRQEISMTGRLNTKKKSKAKIPGRSSSRVLPIKPPRDGADRRTNEE
jgi:hypothetical protein